MSNYHDIPEDAPIAGNQISSRWKDLPEEDLESVIPWFASYALQRPQIAAGCKRVIQSPRLLWTWCNEMSLYREDQRARHLRTCFRSRRHGTQIKWNRSRQLIECIEQILDTDDSAHRSHLVQELFGVLEV